MIYHTHKEIIQAERLEDAVNDLDENPSPAFRNWVESITGCPLEQFDEDDARDLAEQFLLSQE